MPPTGPVDLKKAIDYTALANRNVLITGAASGFGSDFARIFAKHKANVVLADIQDGAGRALEKELTEQGANVKYIHVDVLSFDSQVALIQGALDFFPRNEVDIFVPSAGVLEPPTQISPQDPSELAGLKSPPADLASRVILTNLAGVFTGVLLVARYAMGLHKTADGGLPKPAKSIVLIASLAGYCGAEGSVEYTTAKFGVRGILRGLRKQMAGLGVRLNLVAPFYVETPMTADVAPVLKSVGIPLATVDQVSEAVVRLAADEDAYGRSVFVMPEGLSDGGDDSTGMQSGKAFSVDALGEHWGILINGPMSDEIQPDA